MAEILLLSNLHSMKTEIVIKKKTWSVIAVNQWEQLPRISGRNSEDKNSAEINSILILACQCLIHPSTNCLENCSKAK